MSYNIKILIVDDDEVIRCLFKDLLTDKGYEVKITSSGEDAIEQVKEGFFQIAFVDVHMPGIGGIEALKIIKKISPETVIVTTDSFPDIFVDQSLKAGAITCIHKPFEIKEVYAVVDRIIKDKEKAASA